jgi:hypothetical protein
VLWVIFNKSRPAGIVCLLQIFLGNLTGKFNRFDTSLALTQNFCFIQFFIFTT